MKALAVSFTALVLATATVAQEGPLERGRELTEAFLAQDLEQVFQSLGPALQASFGSAEGLAGFRQQVEGDLGAEGEVIDERVRAELYGLSSYLRTSRFSGVEQPILTQWTLAPDGTAVLLLIVPAPVAAESAFLDYETVADLSLPVRGEWYVYWGGRDISDNYHAVDPAQRFALDLLIVREGATFSGEAGVLENYYCWDQPILAPAAGTVVRVTNDLPDNPIGQTDTANPAGNHVVIDLGASEFAFLGHMRQGSVSVSAGDTVAAGDEIGRCGNSGNTSEPHLHFHLQTTADLAAGEGLPAQFQNYVANGLAITRGEPERGEVIGTPE